MKLMGSWGPDTHTLRLRDSSMWVSLSFQNLIYEDNTDSIVCERGLFFGCPPSGGCQARLTLAIFALRCWNTRTVGMD